MEGKNPKISSFKDLLVWQRSMDVVIEVYKVTNKFPQSENFGLKSQMQRAATSIPFNIAEGFGRGHKKEYINFLKISRGSCCELETQLEVSCRLRYITEQEYENIHSTLEIIYKMLNSLCHSIERSSRYSND